MESTEATGGSMAYEYDRFEREDGGGSFLMGLLAGTVLGAGLGMLFAPKPGAELRTKLTEQAGKLRTTAADGYQQAAGKRTTARVRPPARRLRTWRTRWAACRAPRIPRAAPKAAACRARAAAVP